MLFGYTHIKWLKAIPQFSMTRQEKRTCSQLQLNSSILFTKNLILLPTHSPNHKERQFFKKPTKPKNRDLGIKPKSSPETVLMPKKKKRERIGKQISIAHQRSPFKKNSETQRWNYGGAVFKTQIIKAQLGNILGFLLSQQGK